MLKITKNQGSIQVTADKSGFYPFDGTITFPTNSLFTATSANTDMITFKSTSNGDVQFVGNYKDITISGRSYDTKQKFLTAFSNLANQGSVDAYTKAETDAKLNDKLTAKTNANGSLFISSSSNNDANSSVALYNSWVSGANDVAIGWASTSDKGGVHNLAILNQATANGSHNIAIGDQRRCNGSANVGIGSGKYNTTDVNGTSNVCIGDSSQAHTLDNTAVNKSIAIGSNATASGDYCTVVGTSASAHGSHAVAIGDSAHGDSTATRSVAVGSEARAHGERAVAIGNLSYADNDRPLDICCGKTADNSPLRVIQSDANGKISLLKGDGTDTRMVIQDEIEALKNAGGGSANPFVIVKGTNGDATISDSVTDAVAIGSNASVDDQRGVAVGPDASASNSGVAVGPDAKAADSSVAVGPGSVSLGWSVAVGTGARANHLQTVSIGTDAFAWDTYCVAVGPGAQAKTDKPLVINAGYKTVDNVRQPLTVLQSDATGKLSILKGDGTDERIVIQDALSAGGSGGGTVDAYTKAETDTKLDAKQDKLTAGSGITITKDETAGTSTIATAVSLTDNGNGAYQVGDSIEIGSDTVTIGTSAVSRTKWSIAIGNGATSGSGGSNIAIGILANSSGGTSIAIGKNAVTSNINATAIGTNASANIPKSIAIGYGAKAVTNIPMVINAGGKTMIQGDANGKISIPLGDGTTSTMCLQDEIAALKAEIAALKGGASTGA